MKWATIIDLIFTDYLTDITAVFLQFYSFYRISYNDPKNLLNIFLWIVCGGFLIIFPFYFSRQIFHYSKNRREEFK